MFNNMPKPIGGSGGGLNVTDFDIVTLQTGGIIGSTDYTIDTSLVYCCYVHNNYTVPSQYKFLIKNGVITWLERTDGTYPITITITNPTTLNINCSVFHMEDIFNVY